MRPLICEECEITKEIDQFYKNKNYPNGLEPKCKQCRNVKSAANYEKNRDRLKAVRAAWYQENKDWYLPHTIEYAKRDDVRERRNAKERDKTAARTLITHEKRKKIAEKKKNAEEERKRLRQLELEDRIINKDQYALNNRLKKNLRCRLWYAIKEAAKSDGTMNLVGCSIEELKIHLSDKFTEGMAWDNYGFGDDKWHIDHIKPCCSFDLTDPEQQKICFHYTNLQPLWQPENLRKSKKLTPPFTDSN